MSQPARTYHHGDLRAQLLARAAELVARDGAEAFSLRAVAAELGVSHTAPRHHFGDRLGVFTALAAEGYTLLSEALETAAPLGFAEVGAAYVLFAVSHPGHFAVMHAPDLVHGDDPALAAAASRANRQLVDGVADVAPGTRDQVAVKAAAAWALVHGLATLALSGALERDRLMGSGLGDLHHLVLRATSLLDLTRDGEIDDPFQL
ncbi:TetR/AcrR family transcriptional regulator [Microlunatus flavus]|uniref:DNA-binding transcriptional regulator, AcrR family n=1 Tax=Microlunatus flavus TaxID=1036181 RepID=A0A1H9KW45_9ACTN|nr:TetR/AcrR family transcriptional regulator [Microlunatus flavus]SER03414.1 DNA-binding transcriptional regulator, AcrR family [Microlunatus flavus]